MLRKGLRVETLFLWAALLVTTSAGGTDCDGPLDIGRGEVVFHVPSSYDPEAPTPLVIMLHGYAVTASFEEEYLRLEPLSDLHGFLYALPDPRADCGKRRSDRSERSDERGRHTCSMSRSERASTPRDGGRSPQDAARLMNNAG
jgi:poly(3-hydroxybutyrate) depolymerase